MRQTYDLFKPQIHHTYEQEKPALSAYLKDQVARDALNQLVGKLRVEQGDQILLEPPRFNVPAGNHPEIGPKNAPVTIVEFGDFQCPFTRKAEDTLKQIFAKYPNKIKLVYIGHPLWLHEHARFAEKAARCANEQGKFWPYHDALFADQSKLAEADLKATAARLKLDTKQFNKCYDEGTYEHDLATDQLLAGSLRIEGTPTFYVNGRLVFGAESADEFEKIVDQELAATGSRRAARD